MNDSFRGLTENGIRFYDDSKPDNEWASHYDLMYDYGRCYEQCEASLQGSESTSQQECDFILTQTIYDAPQSAFFCGLNPSKLVEIGEYFGFQNSDALDIVIGHLGDIDGVEVVIDDTSRLAQGLWVLIPLILIKRVFLVVMGSVFLIKKMMILALKIVTIRTVLGIGLII